MQYEISCSNPFWPLAQGVSHVRTRGPVVSSHRNRNRNRNAVANVGATSLPHANTCIHTPNALKMTRPSMIHVYTDYGVHGLYCPRTGCSLRARAQGLKHWPTPLASHYYPSSTILCYTVCGPPPIHELAEVREQPLRHMLDCTMPFRNGNHMLRNPAAAAAVD